MAREIQAQMQRLLDECARLREEQIQLRAENSRLQAEIARLLAETAHLREQPGTPYEEPSSAPLTAATPPPPSTAQPSTAPATAAPTTDLVTHQSPRAAKVALFRSLFRGREDVFAQRWESKGGKAGYSPACRHEWVPGICTKPHTKCTRCEYLPLTDHVIEAHLTGKETIGAYALQLDETCWFLAADFDKHTWQADVTAFLETCDELGVPAAVERSRSGNGAHVWIFFAAPISASLARNLGAAILTRTMERHYQLGLDSYDRFFPNQDTMPKGGFGNLVALPLQSGPRKHGNSLFVDRDFQPHPDQWAFLAQVRRMHPHEVEAIVDAAAHADRLIGVQLSLTDEDESEDPWTLPPSGRKAAEPITGPLPDKVRIVLSNLVYVEKEGLPQALLNRLLRLAAFQNPEFYQAQRMRMSTFDKPRIIGCGEDFPHHIGLPRGCLDEVLDLLKAHHVEPELTDERFGGVPFDAAFQGELSPLQQEAALALAVNDMGILSATTAFGKTVVGAWLVAARQVNTLVLVHRRQLMDQWRERLATFLGVPVKSIGLIGGGKAKPTGVLDIAVIQSLNRKGEVKDLVANYGQIIVDECHHLSAFSFEQVLKKAKARYVVGLTATPVRKDGHHPIILMQCGPIRFRVDAKKQAADRPFAHLVIPRHTDFRLPADARDLGIQEIYRLLTLDDRRNAQIVADILQAAQDGRCPLVLTERTQHLNALAEQLQGRVQHLILLRGGMGAKQRRAVAEQLAAIPEGAGRIVLATGRYIGEGFDDPRLDTLFLAMPISWRGTLQQYAGRLHRLHDRKQVVQVYDYVDEYVPMLARMFEKRLKGYRAIGYAIDPRKSLSEETGHARQATLWSNGRS